MKKVTVYTDGSHFKDKDFIGFGAFCEFEGKTFEYSNNATQKTFKDFYCCNENVSNPTAEMAAAAGVLREFSKVLVPVHVEIVADYIGVKEWNEGNWKAKKPYIIGLMNSISAYTSMIEATGGKVTYRHIRGHQRGETPDIIGNNNSDVLAKSSNLINNFTDLVCNFLNKQNVLN